MNNEEILQIKRSYRNRVYAAFDTIDRDLKDISERRDEIVEELQFKYPNMVPVDEAFESFNHYCYVKNGVVESSEELSDLAQKIHEKTTNKMHDLVFLPNLPELRLCIDRRGNEWLTFEDFCDIYGEIDGELIWEHSARQEISQRPEDRLSNYTFGTLPFAKTRSAWNLEKELYTDIAEYYNIKDHIMRLDRASLRLKTETKRAAWLVKLDESEQKELGFRKTLICNDIKELLDESMKVTNDRKDKIDCARKIFEYLDTDECKRFLFSHNKLRVVLVNKLHDFYHIDGLKEASTWYRRIFGERMPLEKESYP